MIAVSFNLGFLAFRVNDVIKQTSNSRKAGNQAIIVLALAV